MRTSMKTDELLKLLYANREKHIREFKEQWDGFLVTVMEDTQSFAAEVSANGKPNNGRWALNWTVPESHESDYDVAIRMVELHSETTIELGDTDFENLVLDDWQWKRQFGVTESMYSGKFK